MSRLLAPLLPLLVAACSATPARPPLPPTPPRPPSVGARPPTPPRPPVVHPQLALDAAGVASVARSWAWQRGWPSEVQRLERDGAGYRVRLKLPGPEIRGELVLHVDEWSGAVRVLEEDLRGGDGERD